jgi:gluconolactonase
MTECHDDQRRIRGTRSANNVCVFCDFCVIRVFGKTMTQTHYFADLSKKTIFLVILLMAQFAAAQQPEIATTVAFTEGPASDREGNVYFTEIINQRIMKLGKDGVLSTYREHSNVANGLLIDPQGRLIACEGAEFERPGVKVKGKPQVTRTDLKSGKMEVLADNVDGTPLQGPNDVTIDGKGRLYFTDLPGAAVYRIDAPGKVARILAAPDVQRPNGIQVSPDDRKLYLIEANQAQGGARMIRSYDLQPDGTVRNMKVHYNFYPGRSADGMSIDTQGNLYASAGMNQLRGSSETLDNKTGIYVISPEGRLLKFIPIAEDYITNNAFGGPDMKTLYVTAGKTLYKVRTEIAGLPR